MVDGKKMKMKKHYSSETYIEDQEIKVRKEKDEDYKECSNCKI